MKTYIHYTITNRVGLVFITNISAICAGPQSTPINGFPNFLIASDTGPPPSDFWPYCYYIVVVYRDQPQRYVPRAAKYHNKCAANVFGIIIIAVSVKYQRLSIVTLRSDDHKSPSRSAAQAVVDNRRFQKTEIVSILTKSLS